MVHEMKYGMGIGWVQRWFAKPLDKGSIPSHASNLDLIFDAVGGYDAARKALKDAAYNKGYHPPTDHVLLAREIIWHLSGDAKQAKYKLITLSKELSQMKRSKS